MSWIVWLIWGVILFFGKAPWFVTAALIVALITAVVLWLVFRKVEG